MDPRFTVHVPPEFDVKDALLIVGTPGLGLVGTIASQYAVRHLKMRPAGGIHSPSLPPRATIVNGRPMPPIRLHFAHEQTRLPFACDKLLVLTTEMAVEEAAAPFLAEAIGSWARAARVRAIVVLDGILVEAEEGAEPGDLVVGVPSSDTAAKLLEAEKVDALQSGFVGGLVGALLHAGERHGVDVVALLAEASANVPDARASVRLVEILDRMVPGIKIETAPLLKEAETIEAMVREQVKRQDAMPSTAGEGTYMYG